MARINDFDFEKEIDEKVEIFKTELKKIESEFSEKFSALSSFKEVASEIDTTEVSENLDWFMKQKVRKQVDYFTAEINDVLDGWNV